MQNVFFFTLKAPFQNISLFRPFKKKATNSQAEGKRMFFLLEYLNIKVKSTECSGCALGEYWRVSSGIYLSALDALCVMITFSNRRREMSTPQGTLSVWQWCNGYSVRAAYNISQYFKIKSRRFSHSENFCSFCVRNTVHMHIKYNSEEIQSLKVRLPSINLSEAQMLTSKKTNGIKTPSHSVQASNLQQTQKYYN